MFLFLKWLLVWISDTWLIMLSQIAMAVWQQMTPWVFSRCLIYRSLNSNRCSIQMRMPFFFFSLKCWEELWVLIWGITDLEGGHSSLCYYDCPLLFMDSYFINCPLETIEVVLVEISFSDVWGGSWYMVIIYWLKIKNITLSIKWWNQHKLVDHLALICLFGLHFLWSKVWAIADSKRQGFLGIKEFIIAMQVVLCKENETPKKKKNCMHMRLGNTNVVDSLGGFFLFQLISLAQEGHQLTSSLLKSTGKWRNVQHFLVLIII